MNLKIFLGVGGTLVVIGAALLILWAVGVFGPARPPPRKPPTGKKILNTYTLSPNNTWTYWDPEGTEIRGIGIQQLANDLFVTQKYKAEAEFANTRVVIFLLPGRYEQLHLQVGYYTSVVGLGAQATDTVVQGTIEVPNHSDPCIGALENNFRNIANLTIEVDTSTLFSDDITDPEAPTVADRTIRQRLTNYFRVSQASPIRNIHVKGTDAAKQPHISDVRGNFAVSQFTGGCRRRPDSGGYSSGGFMANVALSAGEMRFGTQQQFFSRNCDYNIRSANPEMGGGGAWNIYMMGCVGETGQTAVGRKIISTAVNKCPPNSSDVDDDNDSEDIDDAGRPPPLITWKEITPGLMASIPQIRYEHDTFSILKPELVNNSSGLLPVEGEKLTNVFIVEPNTSIKTINKKLAAGVNLIFSPWVYHFDEPVRITQSGSVVMTLGYATIIPTGGHPAIVVADDAEGVRLSGFLLQAGKKRSEALLLVGEHPRDGGSQSNPTIIYDIFSRVGGGEIEPGDDPAVVNPDFLGTCETMVVVNQNHTILDHIWCWRADHVGSDQSGLGTEFARVDHAVVVRGDRVKMFGVFAENALKEQIVWEGDSGELYFQQSTLPSDVSGDWDYPGTRVTGRDFKGSGMGVYSFFSNKHTVDLDPPVAAPEVPTAFLVFNEDDEEAAATAEIESCFTVFLDAQGGSGVIKSVLNGRGPSSNASNATKPQWCGTLCADVNDCECQLPFSQWCDVEED